MQSKEEDLIENYLGYLPLDRNYLPYMEDIRALIERHENNECDQAQFDDEARQYAMGIRNDEMKEDGIYCRQEKMDWVDEYLYKTTFPERTTEARDRLARFLGYYPDIIYSFHAECFLRCLLSTRMGPEISAPDYRAMTIVKYREVLLTQGQEAADKSPLVKMQMQNQPLAG